VTEVVATAANLAPDAMFRSRSEFLLESRGGVPSMPTDRRLGSFTCFVGESGSLEEPGEGSGEAWHAAVWLSIRSRNGARLSEGWHATVCSLFEISRWHTPCVKKAEKPAEACHACAGPWPGPCTVSFHRTSMPPDGTLHTG